MISASSDFETLIPISVTDITTEVRLYTSNDFVILEYNDIVKLIYTPNNVSGFESLGEYVRDNTVVNIIDDDIRCCF